MLSERAPWLEDLIAREPLLYNQPRLRGGELANVEVVVAPPSSAVTLAPGDIIMTGTPAGVGIGFEPPIYLKTGDHVEVMIDKIGKLENTVK